MRNLMATIGFMTALASSAAAGDDLELGPFNIHVPAGRLSDAANRCAARDMSAVFAGLKSDKDWQNVARLVGDLSLAKRLVRKCAPPDLPIWNVDNAQARIVLPMWTAVIFIRRMQREDAVENAYYACLKEKAVLFAGVSDENAEAVIAAARGACFNQRRAIYDAVPPNLNPEEEADKADRRIHDRMMEWVIGVRAELKARGSRPPDEPVGVKQRVY